MRPPKTSREASKARPSWRSRVGLTQSQALRLIAYAIGIGLGGTLQAIHAPVWGWVIASIAGGTLIILAVKEGSVWP